MASAKQSIPFPVFSQLHTRTESVTQLEIELFISLRNRLQQLETQFAASEAALKSRLEAGATVDPGIHVAELKENFRRHVAWKDVVIRLAERLKLNGEAYCAKVLAATKPSRTVSLVVE
jgi:hypothetical protein